MDLVRTLEDHWVACIASAEDVVRVTRLPGALVVSSDRWAGTLTNFIALREAGAAGIAPLLEAGSALLLQSKAMPLLFHTPFRGGGEETERDLRRLGWVLGGRQRVLWRSLASIPEWRDAQPVVEAVGVSSLAEWARLLTRAYGLTGTRARQVQTVWSAVASSPGPEATPIPVWARLGGRPVGTGLAWVHGSIAGLYCGAVLEKYRRCGVETGTLQFRLSAAVEQGARLAYIHTEVGSPVERICLDRLGFHVAHERSFWFPVGHGDIVQNVWI